MISAALPSQVSSRVPLDQTSRHRNHLLHCILLHFLRSSIHVSCIRARKGIACPDDNVVVSQGVMTVALAGCRYKATQQELEGLVVELSDRATNREGMSTNTRGAHRSSVRRSVQAQQGLSHSARDDACGGSNCAAVVDGGPAGVSWQVEDGTSAGGVSVRPPWSPAGKARASSTSPHRGRPSAGGASSPQRGGPTAMAISSPQRLRQGSSESPERVRGHTSSQPTSPQRAGAARSPSRAVR